MRCAPLIATLRMDGVMQRLAEDREVHRALSRWADLRCRPAGIRDSRSHALPPASRRTRPSWASYRSAITFFAVLARSCDKRSFARAEIGHILRRQERDQRMRERLPGTSRHVTAAKFSGQLVEVGARLVLPFAQRDFQRGSVARRLRQFARQRLASAH